MGTKQALTRFLMNHLPAEEQAQLVSDVIAWRFASLRQADQQARIEQFGPGLMQMMREGRVGLPLIITRHLLRLPVVRRLAQWVVSAQHSNVPFCRSPDQKKTATPSTATSHGSPADRTGIEPRVPADPVAAGDARDSVENNFAEHPRTAWC